MNKSSLWTWIGVIVAVVIAWFVIELLFHVMFFVAKLAAVAVVAVIVYFVLHLLFSRGEE
ncbi:hypothetical protein [Microbacterium sediminis]|uniref:Uncharacterized protein n=1 Tax=Microbacterium sediminis TaxID=904291 RepID=A0A1B9NHY8_9MICO|nr:hypothetical protein [Microbacterium sediminis]OCG76229.1 hypothetical protein A7J15_12460 [Microbacterium sediminis]QBR73405.1 hypothetical protein E3O41_02480 [Microbacterium sediminis]